MSELLLRSWLFEIVDTETQFIDESFTLILPPQSCEIKEGQRVNVTKTFANIFVDDYGSDNLEITLKGISGTSSIFKTFQTSTPTDIFNEPLYFFDVKEAASATTLTGGVGYNARSAFYKFRNTIIRYKDKYPQTYDKKELRVYDLHDEQAYKCVLLNFDLNRDSDKPFW